MALGLQDPWSVTDVRSDATPKETHFEALFKAGSRFACQSCGAADQPVHDTRQPSREHLRFFEHKAFIRSCVPRVACSQCGKTVQIIAPWARSGSGFSQLFDVFVIALSREMPVKTIADLFEVGDDRIWRVLDHYVPAARKPEDFSEVTAGGIDETAAQRGHNYIINGLIQVAKARARGYRKLRNFILMVYLIAGNLSHLPASPYRTTSGAIIE